MLTLEDGSLLRTLDSIRTDASNIPRNKSHNNGVKFVSCLNELKYFNVIWGLPPDPMHDILEGAVRQHFKQLMSYLEKSKLYSVAELNDDLKNFNYGRLDGENKVFITLNT